MCGWPPSRVEAKYSVPSRVTEGPQCQLLSGVLTGAGSAWGSPQPLAVRRTDQMRNARALTPGTMRVEEKNMVLPSGERRGERSRYCPPENDRTSGSDHRPLRRRETQRAPTRGNVVVRFAFAKKNSLPSRLNEPLLSSSSVDTTP